MLLDIDIIIVLIFLALTLMVGLTHGQKVKTITDYALGGRNFSTGALVATIVATKASGSGFLIMLSKTYSDGFYYLFATTATGVSLLFISFFLIPRMGEFLGRVSIAEAMGDLYGNKVRFITAIAGTIGSAGLIAVQFKVFGSVVSYFIGMPPITAIIVSGIIVTIYSAFGGIRAVTFTDILQGFSFGVVIPLLGFVIWSQFYNMDHTVTSAMSNPKFDLNILFDSSKSSFWGLVLLFIYYTTPDISAPDFQRISMGSGIKQIKKAFIISAIILVTIKFAIAWIPFIMYSINPKIESGQLLPYIVDTYSFTGLKGLIIVAIIAFAMSTADSRINSSSVLFTHDIYGLFNKNTKNELFVAKIFSLILGFGTIFLSLIETDLLGIIVFTGSFYSPLVAPPFLLAILGFRSSTKSVLIGMSVALIITIIWKFLPDGTLPMSQNIIGFLFSMLCNTICLFGSHYLLKQPGGWVGIKDSAYLDEQKIIKQQKQTNFDQYISQFSIRSFCKKIAPRSDLTYTTLGLYFVICTITTMYSTQTELLGSNAELMKIIYPSMLVTGTLMSMYQIWPLSISDNIKKAIIETWYPIAIFYMLIFFSCFFVLVSKFDMLQMALFVTNIMIAALLLGWRLSLPAIVTGFYLATKFYQFYFDGAEFTVQFGSPEFILIYIVLFISSTVMFFFKPKQEQQEETEFKADTLEKEVCVLDGQVVFLNEKVGHLEFHADARKSELSKALELKNEFLRNLQHESRTPITGITSLGEVLYDCYDSLSDEQRKSYLKDIAQSSTRLNSYVGNLTDLSKLESLSHELKEETIDFAQLVNERTEICKKLYITDKNIGKQEFVLNLEEGVIGEFDRYHISQVIDNVIINAIQYCTKGKITINLSQTKDAIKFSVSDEGIGVPKEDLYDIFGAFTVSSITKTPAGGRGVGLALCKKIMELNNGVISAAQNSGKGATFTFVLPKK